MSLLKKIKKDLGAQQPNLFEEPIPSSEISIPDQERPSISTSSKKDSFFGRSTLIRPIGKIEPKVYVDPITGTLYIKTPTQDTYTVYSSKKAYNERSEVPEFKPTNSLPSGVSEVTIDLKTLTIK